MSNATKPANSQASVSAQMAQGSTAARNRILALRQGCEAKPDHRFCPPTLHFDSNKTRRIQKTSI